MESPNNEPKVPARKDAFDVVVAAIRWWTPVYMVARTYNKRRFRADFSASLTVAMLNVPQGIAYAMIAGLPPIYGLYSSIVLTLVFSVVGNSGLLISGPTNAISLILAGTVLNSGNPIVLENPIGAVALLTLMVGAIQLAFGLFKVGNLSQFVSRSVLIGFTAGAGLLIALNQIAGMLGAPPQSSGHLLLRVWYSLSHMVVANPWSVSLALGTMLLLLVGRRWLPRWPMPLITIALSAAFVWVYDLGAKGVRLAGEIPSSLPSFLPPSIDLTLVADLAGAAIAVAILGCIESLSVSKSITLFTNQRMDANRDFVGLGVSHIVGGFFQCMPGCGSFTRSVLNFQSGAKTRFSGIFVAIWIAIVLLAFAPAARYIPAPALAALLVVLGLSLIEPKEVLRSMRATKSDAAVFSITFFSTLLLHLDTAIYIGVLASLVLFLRKASAPHLVEYNVGEDTMTEIRDPKERVNPEVSIIHVEGDLFFGAAEMFEDQVLRVAADPNVRVLILRLKNARHLDATAAAAIEQLHRYLAANGRLLLISGASPDVLRVIRNSGLQASLGAENIFEAEENLTAATRRALKRAKEFLGAEVSAEVRVFYERSRAEKSKPATGA